MVSFACCVWYGSVWLLLLYFSFKKQPRAARRVNCLGWQGRGARVQIFAQKQPTRAMTGGAVLQPLMIGTASGAAGRAYSALDDFVEFHRGGACLASFHA